jgi:hypothetical protein
MIGPVGRGAGLMFDAPGSYDRAWPIGVPIGFGAGIVQTLAGGPHRRRDAGGRRPEALPPALTLPHPKGELIPPRAPARVFRGGESYC